MKSIAFILSKRDNANYTYKGFINVGGALKLHFQDETRGMAVTLLPDEADNFIERNLHVSSGN
jgi:hypothetical protein